MAFLIFLTVELGHGFGWLNDYGIARFSFILAGLWWIIFGLPFLKNAHQRYSVPKEQKPIVASFARVIKTMRHIRQYRAAFWLRISFILTASTRFLRWLLRLDPIWGLILPC